MSADSAGAARSTAVPSPRSAVAAPFTAVRPEPFRRDAAASCSAAPSSISLSRSSWPAASLRSTSERHDATWSTHTSTWNSWRPSEAVVKLPAPAVRRELRHRLLEERLLARRAVAHDGAQLLVAVAHDVALDDDVVALRALHGPASTLDGREDVVDLDPRGLRAGRGGGHGRHSA